MDRHLASLQDLLNQFKVLQATQEEEMSRLRGRFDWLEARRRELFDMVSLNNGDLESRHKLEETEARLEETRQLISRAEMDMKSGIQDIRQRLLETRNQELARLDDENKLLRRRKDEIHKSLMPEAVARVEGLQQETETLDHRCEEIARLMRELNQLDLDTMQPA